MTDSKISVLIPAYNEQALIEAVLRRVHACFARVGDAPYEIVVCDNNSTDRTAALAAAAGIGGGAATAGCLERSDRNTAITTRARASTRGVAFCMGGECADRRGLATKKVPVAYPAQGGSPAYHHPFKFNL